MNRYNMEKTERLTKAKAVCFTLLIHFGLLFGLFYMNSENPSELVPEFVKEWVAGDQVKEAVASQDRNP